MLSYLANKLNLTNIETVFWVTVIVQQAPHLMYAGGRPKVGWSASDLSYWELGLKGLEVMVFTQREVDWIGSWRVLMDYWIGIGNWRAGRVVVVRIWVIWIKHTKVVIHCIEKLILIQSSTSTSVLFCFRSAPWMVKIGWNWLIVTTWSRVWFFVIPLED